MSCWQHTQVVNRDAATVRRGVFWLGWIGYNNGRHCIRNLQHTARAVKGVTRERGGVVATVCRSTCWHVCYSAGSHRPARPRRQVTR